MRSPHTTMQRSPASRQLEKALAKQQRPNAARKEGREGRREGGRKEGRKGESVLEVGDFATQNEISVLLVRKKMGNDFWIRS